MVALLNSSQIQELSSQIPDWKVEGKHLKIVKTFKDLLKRLHL
jgi:4a-hydroxytetrahydrobiopterin dehydratase